MAQLGWEIAGTFYPHVGFDGLLHGDHALMREVTGLSLAELDDGDDPDATETAWIAVAVWHQNLELRRGEVRKFIERLPKDGAKRVGFEEAESPLAETPDQHPIDPSSLDSGKTSSSSDSTPAAASSGSASPSTTKSSEEPTPELSTLNGSGGQRSDTGATSAPTISDPSTSVAA